MDPTTDQTQTPADNTQQSDQPTVPAPGAEPVADPTQPVVPAPSTDPAPAADPATQPAESVGLPGVENAPVVEATPPAQAGADANGTEASAEPSAESAADQNQQFGSF